MSALALVVGIGLVVLWFTDALVWFVAAPPAFWLEFVIARRILANRYDREGMAERLKLNVRE
ncbi:MULTISPECIES: hypothetical protein [Isoptericola]|nr:MULTISPECIES: hypothetical protein [Isoptericola]MCK0117187.1 hypothetical protein [Isoptericola sp. S6320L]